MVTLDGGSLEKKHLHLTGLIAPRYNQSDAESCPWNCFLSQVFSFHHPKQQYSHTDTCQMSAQLADMYFSTGRSTAQRSSMQFYSYVCCTHMAPTLFPLQSFKPEQYRSEG